MTQPGDREHDLDRTVIRMGGRAYTATGLLQAALVAAVGLGGVVLGATGWQPGWAVGVFAGVAVALYLFRP